MVMCKLKIHIVTILLNVIDRIYVRTSSRLLKSVKRVDKVTLLYTTILIISLIRLKKFFCKKEERLLKFLYLIIAYN